jgi:hypothetical protein
MRDMRRAFGENKGQWMEIPDMAEAIPDSIFDFIIFDACSMGAVECAYELKNDCRIFISSPSEILVAGFPFKQIAPMLFTPSPDYDKIAKSFNDYYFSGYDPYASISVINCSRLNSLASIMKEIIGDETAMYAVNTDTLQILSYINGSPTALYDLRDVMTQFQMDESLRDRFISHMEESVTSAYHTGRHYSSQLSNPIKINTYSGLSIYPMRENLSKLNDWYRQLRWYKDVYR